MSRSPDTGAAAATRRELTDYIALAVANAELAKRGMRPAASVDHFDNPGHWREIAGNTLAALDAAGMTVLPADATQEMSDAGYSAMRDVGGADFREDAAHTVLAAMAGSSPFTLPAATAAPRL